MWPAIMMKTTGIHHAAASEPNCGIRSVLGLWKSERELNVTAEKWLPRLGITMRLRRSSRRGPLVQCRNAAFTLMEVVVALAVILVLAAVAVPTLAGYLDEQNVDAAAPELA